MRWLRAQPPPMVPATTTTRTIRATNPLPLLICDSPLDGQTVSLHQSTGPLQQQGQGRCLDEQGEQYHAIGYGLGGIPPWMRQGNGQGQGDGHRAAQATPVED